MTYLTREECRTRGFKIDDTCYPPFAYKGDRFAPTEKAPTRTCLEEAQAQQLAAHSRLSVADYKVLELADIVSDGAVSRVLNENGKCGWTVCPTCHVDDFVHVEGCATGDAE